MNRLQKLLIGAVSLALLLATGCLEEDKLESLPAPGEQQEEQNVPAQESEPELQPIPQPSETETEQSESESASSGNSKSLRQESGFHVVQVGIAPTRSQANKLTNRLSEEGIPAYVAEVENPADYQGTYYRIRVGYFATVSDAKTFGKDVLASLGYAYWVDNRSNDNVGNPGGEGEYYQSYSEPEPQYESQPASSDWNTPAEEEPAQDEGWGDAESTGQEEPAQDEGWGDAESTVQEEPAPAADEWGSAEQVQEQTTEQPAETESIPTEPEPKLDVAPTESEVIPENAPETVDDDGGWGEPVPPAPADEESEDIQPAAQGASDGWGAPADQDSEEAGWGAPAAPEEEPAADDGGWSTGGDSEWN